jgi:hypothetical protein
MSYHDMLLYYATIDVVSHPTSHHSFHSDGKRNIYLHLRPSNTPYSTCFAVKPGAMAETNENPVVFFDIALGGEL